MQMDEVLAQVSRLPTLRQQEVIDFVTFLEQRYADAEHGEPADWSEQQFHTLSVEQAMRGLEEDEDFSGSGLKVASVFRLSRLAVLDGSLRLGQIRLQVYASSARGHEPPCACLL